MHTLITAMLLAVLAASATNAAELANVGKAGVQARSFNEVLRYRDDDIDIGTAALLLSQRSGAKFDVRRYREMIDKMAEAVISRLQTKHIPADARAITVINEYLFDELRYTAVDNADDARNLFLDTVMDSRKGYCLSLSILYLAIGERVGMPLYGVVVPGHFFVRYDDGVRQYNIETTSNGNIAADDYYIDKFKVPARGYSGIYMKSLTSRETLGCFLNNLSNVHQAQGQLDDAMENLEMAVQIAPGVSMMHSNLGNLYAKKGWPDKALREYELAIGLNPDESKAYHNRAGTYVTLGRRWDAIRDFDRAIALDPNFIEAYRGIAEAYCQEKHYAEALRRLEKARRLAPRDVDIVIQMGDVYRGAGDAANAITAYKQALKARPGDVRALFGLGLSYGQQGQTDLEIDAYKQTVGTKVKPEEKEYKRLALFNMGNAYMSRNSYDQASAVYKLALAMKPDDSPTLHNLAVASMRKEDYDNAVEWYERLLALEPDNAEAHNSLGIALYYLKRYEPAWEHISRARQLGAEVQDDLYKFLAKKAGERDNNR